MKLSISDTVRFLERKGHVLDDCAGLADGKAALSVDSHGEILALKELEHQGGNAMPRDQSMFEDAYDVRASDLRSHPRLSNDATRGGRLLGRLRRENLHDDLDAERAVLGDP